jgi:hypothetical protein
MAFRKVREHEISLWNEDGLQINFAGVKQQGRGMSIQHPKGA